MNPSTKRKTGSQNRLVVAKAEEDGRRMAWEAGVSRRKLLYTEWVNSKVLLYNTENYVQYPMIYHNGKEYFLKRIHMCLTEPVCGRAEINTALKINYTSIFGKTAKTQTIKT